MAFKVGQNIQIILGMDLYDAVRTSGLMFAGSSDDACTLATAARGIGQVTGIRPMLVSTNANDNWVKIQWQLTPTNLLYKLPIQKFNQTSWEYSEQKLSQYFVVI